MAAIYISRGQHSDKFYLAENIQLLNFIEFIELWNYKGEMQ